MTGGTIEALDALVTKFQNAYGDGIAEVKKAAASLQDKYALYYVKAFEKISKNQDYAEKEIKRLEGIIAKGNLAPEKMDDLVSRRNILKSFVRKAEEEKSEL